MPYHYSHTCILSPNYCFWPKTNTLNPSPTFDANIITKSFESTKPSDHSGLAQPTANQQSLTIWSIQILDWLSARCTVSADLIIIMSTACPVAMGPRPI